MCTLTLHRGADALLLTINRDELKTRAPESAPALQDALGAAWLAPVDEERGGTWAAVNEYGVAAAILNADVGVESIYVSTPPDRRTRGDIIPQLMRARHFTEAGHLFESEFDHAEFPPFKLVLASVGGVRVYEVDEAGRVATQRLQGSWSMLTSSVFSTEEVTEKRQALFAAWEAADRPHLAGVPMFNAIRMPDGESWSPLMERVHSCTTSICQIEMKRGRRPIMRYGMVRELRVDLETYTFQSPVYSGSQ